MTSVDLAGIVPGVGDLGLGTLERLDARTVWKNEAHDFTPWLRENIRLLGEALGLEIDIDVRREVAVGLFSADLLGTDVASRAGILVENQLAPSNHGHLGQLITYAAGLGTSILVWLTPAIRDEHRQALTWLNENTNEDVLFFGVEIELLRIDGSKPAPHFRVVVEPNEWQKTRSTRAAGGAGGRSTERAARYKQFWRSLLEEILRRDPSATTASPDRVPGQNWYGIPVGRAGFYDNLVFGWEDGGWVVRAELYIDVGDKAQNEAIFDRLLSERSAIEAELGEPLNWSRREDIRACRIFLKRPGSIEDPSEALDEIKSWGADCLLHLRRVFGPRVKTLTLPLPISTETDGESQDQSLAASTDVVATS